MKRLVQRSALIPLVLALLALTVAVAPASASFTCVAGATCKPTVSGSFILSNTTGAASHTITCNFTNGAITVADGDTSITFATLPAPSCSNTFGCNQTAMSIQNVNTWGFTLPGSTPSSANTWSVGFTLGGLTHFVGACPIITTGTLTMGTQTPSCTGSITTAASTISVSCTKLSHTATGSIAVLSKSSGTTFTMSLNLTYTAGALSIS